MYGAYSATDNQDCDGPECSTYPRSIGRPGGLTIFSRRWGNRISEDFKPVPMKWNLNEEEPSDNPNEKHHISETTAESIEDDAECKNEEEQEDQSYSSIAIMHDSHLEKASLSGSVSKHRHFTEATYPASRPNRAGVYNAFSSFAVPVKGESVENTPWKSSLLRTAEKRVSSEKVSETMFMKTPLPERSVTEDHANLCTDSGIGLMATKSLDASNKCSARGLFTPCIQKSVSSESHDILSGFLPLPNKLPNLIEESSSKKPTMNISTPLVSKSKAGTLQNFQGEETPMKSIPLERTDIMELVKIHKSEKKCLRNNAYIENMLNEANKENLSYGMHCELGSSHGQEMEKEEIKLVRSFSHASVLRSENGRMITPSKEDKPSSAKSLSNLFHPNQISSNKISQHLSRIPTPVRSHTPQKVNPKTSSIESTLETSCVEMLDLQTPMKYSYSPNEDRDHERKSSKCSNINKPLVDASSGHANPSLNNYHLAHAENASTNLKNQVSNPCPKQGSPPIHHQHPMVVSNSADHFPPIAHNSVHVNGFQAQTKTSTFVISEMTSNRNEKPSCIFQSAAKSLEPQGSIIQRSSANSVVVNEPTPGFAVPGVTRKPFSLRAPSFNLPQSKYDPNCESKISGATSCAPSSFAAADAQINSNQFQLPSSHDPVHSLAGSAAPSHLHHVEDQNPLPIIQNAKTNYFPVNSQPFDRRNVFPNAPTPVSALPSSQLIAYDAQAFMQSKGNAMSGIPQVSCVNSFNQAMSSCGSGSLQVENLVVAPTSSVPQPTENPPLVQNKLRIPTELESQPIRKAVSSVRPVSLQTNRKILVVNKKHYEVLRLLGKGASSKVYDVLDCQTNRCVAVKRVVLRQDDASVEGYLKEVELLSQLQGSECIIRLLDSEICFEKEYKVLYMVLERGEMDLSTSIKLMSLSLNQPMPNPGQPGGKIPTVTVIYYWVSMLKAVDEIHQKGIVHSDLKPANFLLVGGQVKLIDFGIATAVQVDVTSVTKNDPAGTPNYMSPEAIGLTVSGSPNSQGMFKNPKASYKSDVWSLGCILYSLVYGRSPFQHIMNERMKLDAICNPKYAIPFPVNSAVHPPLLRAMKRCLVRNYRERASIAELKSIDYLCGNELNEDSWNSWKAMATEKILNALSPDCKMQAIKVIQEVFQSPPQKRTPI
ncbi:uncharacterized protein Mps1 [Hetaerina americana]|uniref:uncharacterized protein Mps1 n=1 Tax=Hetaerina americana TaxID=62018 RepID=UPI003A7F468F